MEKREIPAATEFIFFVRRVQVFGGKKCVGAISIDESFSNRLKFSEFLQKTILRENGFGSTKIFYERPVFWLPAMWC